MNRNAEHFEELATGALIGFAVGDALGVPVEFTSREQRKLDPVTGMRGFGTHHQPAGTWSDDTSMTICQTHSLIEKGIDYEDLMARFVDWAKNGNYTAGGVVFDIGNTTNAAIENFLRGVPALRSGCAGDNACGNGSLMRIMPLALYLEAKYGNRSLDERTAEIIHNVSSCTHSHARCRMACGIYCGIVFRMCRMDDLKEAVKGGVIDSLDYYRDKAAFNACRGEFEPLLSITALEEKDIRSGGYVIDTLKAALWCLLKTKSYAECVLRAVNLGRDTDTTAAVAGALAGMWYGEEVISAEWRETLAKYDELKALSKRFAAACAEIGRCRTEQS